MNRGKVGSKKHARYVTRTIQDVVSHVNLETKLQVPRNVLMVGRDYAYTGEIIYGDLLAKHVKRGQITGSPFAIEYRRLLPIKTDDIPLGNIIDSVFEGESELSLVPDGDTILQRAKKLGDITEKQPYLFEVYHGGRLIWFYDVNFIREQKNHRLKTFSKYLRRLR